MATQWSADGQWWWDGQRWIAAAQLRRPGASVPAPAPSRSLLTLGAFACLGLALSSYVVLSTPWFVFAPFTAGISIAVGRAVRHSLPKAERRDRAIADIGILLAVLPLAVVILGVFALQLILGYFIVTGNH
jgi:hypothetical protein